MNRKSRRKPKQEKPVPTGKCGKCQYPKAILQDEFNLINEPRKKYYYCPACGQMSIQRL